MNILSDGYKARPRVEERLDVIALTICVISLRFQYLIFSGIFLFPVGNNSKF